MGDELTNAVREFLTADKEAFEWLRKLQSHSNVTHAQVQEWRRGQKAAVDRCIAAKGKLREIVEHL